MGNLNFFQGRGEVQTSRCSSYMKPRFLIIGLEFCSFGFMLLQTQQERSVSFPVLDSDSTVLHDAGVLI